MAKKVNWKAVRAKQWATIRGGRPWPKKCEGPGKYQHRKGCRPKRPRCRWRFRKHSNWTTCECGVPHYPHRKGSVSWAHGACQHHPEAERINHEMVHLTDWETGEALDPAEVCAERYASDAV